MEKYQGRLFGLVLMMVRQPAGAEEITQDAFVRAYLHLDRYDETRPFYTGLPGGAVPMPAPTVSAVVVAAGLTLYVAGLFAPLADRRRR